LLHNPITIVLNIKSALNLKQVRNSGRKQLSHSKYRLCGTFRSVIIPPFTAMGIRPDIVFSGLVHNYQRFAKHYPDGTHLPYIVAVQVDLMNNIVLPLPMISALLWNGRSQQVSNSIALLTHGIGSSDKDCKTSYQANANWGVLRFTCPSHSHGGTD
jgi:hypothetical protein